MQSAFPKTLFSLGKVDFWETTLILQTIKVILSNHTRETPCSSFRMDAVLFWKILEICVEKCGGKDFLICL